MVPRLSASGPFFLWHRCSFVGIAGGEPSFADTTSEWRRCRTSGARNSGHAFPDYLGAASRLPPSNHQPNAAEPRMREPARLPPPAPYTSPTPHIPPMRPPRNSPSAEQPPSWGQTASRCAELAAGTAADILALAVPGRRGRRSCIEPLRRATGVAHQGRKSHRTQRHHPYLATSPTQLSPSRPQTPSPAMPLPEKHTPSSPFKP